MKELTIVCSDGGLQGGFIAGALAELFEIFPTELGKTTSIAATSASVGGIFYLLSHGDDHPARAIWTSALASEQFLSGSFWESFWNGASNYDINYMVDVVFHSQNPLDFARIYSSKFGVYFSVLNYETLEVEYFTNRPEVPLVRAGRKLKLHDIRDFDLYEIIKATNAAPILYDRAVRLNGADFLDAGQIEPYFFDAPPSQAKKILIATKSDSRLLDTVRYFFAGLLWAYVIPLFRKPNLKRDVYLAVMKKPFHYSALAKRVAASVASGDTLVITPHRKLSGSLDNSERGLGRNFDIGAEWVQTNRDRIAEFLRG